MPDIQTQGIEPLALKKLEDALAEFLIMNPPRNADIAEQVDRVERNVGAVMNRASESGPAVMGAVNALLVFLRSSHGRVLHFRR